MNITINSTCTVTLTSHGAALLNADPARKHTYYPGDKYTRPFWLIMYEFGKHLYAGSLTPFNSIVIVDGEEVYCDEINRGE